MKKVILLLLCVAVSTIVTAQNLSFKQFQPKLPETSYLLKKRATSKKPLHKQIEDQKLVQVNLQAKGISNDWIDAEKIVYQYDTNIFYQKAGYTYHLGIQTWDLSWIEYNTEGPGTDTTHYKELSSGILTDYKRDINTYSYEAGTAKKYLIETVTQEYEDGEWTNTYKSTFGYDIDGNPTEFEEYNWAISEWEKDGKSVISQVGSDVIEEIYVPGNENWELESRIIYKNVTIQELNQKVNSLQDYNNYWTLNSILTFLPDMTVEFYYEGSWIPESEQLRTTEYDFITGKIISQTITIKNREDNGELITQSEIILSYNDLEQVQKSVMNLVIAGEPYKLFEEEYTYTSTNALESIIYIVSVNGELVPTSKVLFTYSNSTANEAPIEVASQIKLNAAYPNPFNPSTTISYSIGKASHVSVKVFDVLGREVAQLVNQYAAAGNYAVRFDSKNLSSGTYIVLLESAGTIQTQKINLIK